MYEGAVGGLYPGGELVRPSAHDAGGLLSATFVEPRDAAGQPDPAGAVVLLALGMSNTSVEFQMFDGLVSQEEGVHSSVVLVNGAQPDQTADAIADPGAPFWDVVEARLAGAGVTAQQVQAVWLKSGHAESSLPFPENAQSLQADLAEVVRIVADRYPNARVCYLSSRIYGGYATGDLSPEPAAYEEGFAVKHLIEDQIGGDPNLNYDPERGAVVAPWLAWGPYVWADGEIPRGDGLTWECDDFVADGVHPDLSGMQKVALELLSFLKTDGTARSWFLADPAPLCGAQARTEKYGTGVAGAGGEVQLVVGTAPVVPSEKEVDLFAFRSAGPRVGGVRLGRRVPRRRRDPVRGRLAPRRADRGRSDDDGRARLVAPAVGRPRRRGLLRRRDLRAGGRGGSERARLLGRLARARRACWALRRFVGNARVNP